MLDWASPSMSGRRLPPEVEDALSVVGDHIQVLVDDINIELDALTTVSLPGHGQVGIQELLDGTAPAGATVLVPSGFVGLFNGTLDDAYALQGWLVMDGRYTDDLLDKYLRASAEGADAGTTGGANTHEHVIGNHTHTQDCTCAPDYEECEVELCGGSGYWAPCSCDHAHANPDTAAGGSITTTAVANEPAWWAGIPIMKI